ncbi:2,3-diaminopropionate biosynthesis protein SbnB [Paenibacillus puerhi]|uniref:2,3-diaminopropionate biosynthesis protein SbnB n=1 Tax=Paenibacillus puerhi TaxID=2692622 RepID=UPI001356F6DE|nr:2,3-diaminopropionate biosynthesis protein SbnB [Paenibacillus puerhi]
MLYLNEGHVMEMHGDWEETVSVIEETVRYLEQGDCVQPVKPYLRFRDPANRIIAMPAFVGGQMNAAGIKWIASFPGNVDKHLPRASCVVILNHADTGEPKAIIHTALLSTIRTASVTGSVIREYVRHRPKAAYNLGITGFGPIGRQHLQMAMSLWGERIGKVKLYDPRPIDIRLIPESYRDKVVVTDSWQDAYEDADWFMTCTVAPEPYIDRRPKEGALLLNISLRDFKNDVFPYVRDTIVVDSWEEVCREKTDIERFHLQEGLQQTAVRSITDLIVGGCMEAFPADAPIMFNPMGMAVFDVAIATYFVNKALRDNVGHMLPA